MPVALPLGPYFPADISSIYSRNEYCMELLASPLGESQLRPLGFCKMACYWICIEIERLIMVSQVTMRPELPIMLSYSSTREVGCT